MEQHTEGSCQSQEEVPRSVPLPHPAAHLLLGLEFLLESQQPPLQPHRACCFLLQNSRQGSHIAVNLAARLVYLGQEVHFLADQLHCLLNLLAVGGDEEVLLLQDAAHQVIPVHLGEAVFVCLWPPCLPGVHHHPGSALCLNRDLPLVCHSLGVCHLLDPGRQPCLGGRSLLVRLRNRLGRGPPVPSLCARSDRPGSPVLLVLAQLLDAVSIPEGVEGVLHAGGAGADVCNHDRPGLLAHKRVAQHLCQLGTAEGDVRLVEVQRTDALLESQQALVDLRPLQACLSFVVVCVGPALATGEVNEGELTHEDVRVASLPAWPLDGKLDNRVTARGVLIGAGAPDAPLLRSVLNPVLDQLGVCHNVLLEPHDVHLLLLVLQDHQLLPAVEQVVQLASIDLKVADMEAHLGPLRVVEKLDDLLSGADREGRHCVGLAAAGLSVSKAGGPSAPEQSFDERVDCAAVDGVVADILMEGVVEVEVVVHHVLAKVDLLLLLVHLDGVGAAHLDNVHVGLLYLLAVQWPLPDHHPDLWGLAGTVIGRGRSRQRARNCLGRSLPRWSHVLRAAARRGEELWLRLRRHHSPVDPIVGVAVQVRGADEIPVVLVQIK
mmetsp:Transcript_18779/g.52312  ORF Transcript_18779/g.52312 Transcript_18779/m.52312 type:complete len:605 (-) Transcript_18779:500-2314(-)